MLYGDVVSLSELGLMSADCRPIGTSIVHHDNERKYIIISYIETINFLMSIQYISHIVINIFVSTTNVLLAPSKFIIRYFSLRIRSRYQPVGREDLRYNRKIT